MTSASHAHEPVETRPRARRRRLVAAVLLVVVLAGAVEAVPGFPGHSGASLLGDLALSDAGAVVAKATSPLWGHQARPCAALESEFGIGNDLLRGTEIGWYASIWPSFQALKALDITSVRSGSEACSRDFAAILRALDAQYWDSSYNGSPAFDQGPHAFHTHSDLPRVDDSLWMGLANMRGYRMTRDRAFLQRADAVYRLAMAEWDRVKGGIYWEYHTPHSTNVDKAVVSNAPAVVLGAALFSVTGRRGYLTGSSRVLTWLETTLLDPRTGLYDDHIDDHARPPTVDTTTLTYDQGIVVGAMTALATVDPGRFHLEDAVALARRSMAYFEAHRSYGKPAFDAIWATNLLWVVACAHDAALAREARSSLSLAVRAAPARSNSLLRDGGERALDELVHLPASRHAELSYTLPDGHVLPPTAPYGGRSARASGGGGGP